MLIESSLLIHDVEEKLRNGTLRRFLLDCLASRHSVMVHYKFNQLSSVRREMEINETTGKLSEGKFDEIFITIRLSPNETTTCCYQFPRHENQLGVSGDSQEDTFPHRWQS